MIEMESLPCAVDDKTYALLHQFYDFNVTDKLLYRGKSEYKVGKKRVRLRA